MNDGLWILIAIVGLSLVIFLLHALTESIWGEEIDRSFKDDD